LLDGVPGVVVALGDAVAGTLGDAAVGVGVDVLVGGVSDPPHPLIKTSRIPTDTLKES